MQAKVSSETSRVLPGGDTTDCFSPRDLHPHSAPASAERTKAATSADLYKVKRSTLVQRRPRQHHNTDGLSLLSFL